MKKLLFILLLFSTSAPLFAQKFIAVDNFGRNRKKIYEGDQIIFKMKDEKTVYKDNVYALKDSSFILYKSGTEIPLSEVETIKFARVFPRVLFGGFGFIGTGFLVSGAVQRGQLDSNGNSNIKHKDAQLVQGAVFWALAIAMRPFFWKNYKLGKNSQAQVLDLTIRKLP
ncbi:hypothetical protein [Flammeovirga kamogawensis]|uniref:Uncharacterized protein n=1 Tax=Flammeovirga kamogawensis TaxID=373891 RepID=A0ABX8GXC3_9BACT|nr:hypothetical protein [Flammeovirga kamogawensis]MBB6461300.1 hypothetical protein [Flammeovirga kamogawensis]QWG07857.1 hypothetical protein KM029_02640 [Flammeovirga kamogawensis]TRX69664.1 hypothetical protein EO216_16575 [Flammeovirga kamogawensis]